MKPFGSARLQASCSRNHPKKDGVLSVSGRVLCRTGLSPFDELSRERLAGQSSMQSLKILHHTGGIRSLRTPILARNLHTRKPLHTTGLHHDNALLHSRLRLHAHSNPQNFVASSSAVHQQSTLGGSSSSLAPRVGEVTHTHTNPGLRDLRPCALEHQPTQLASLGRPGSFSGHTALLRSLLQATGSLSWHAAQTT